MPASIARGDDLVVVLLLRCGRNLSLEDVLRQRVDETKPAPRAKRGWATYLEIGESRKVLELLSVEMTASTVARRDRDQETDSGVAATAPC